MSNLISILECHFGLSENTQPSPSVLARPFDSYSLNAQNEALHRKAYVDALCAELSPCYTPWKLAVLIARVADRIGDSSPPSPTSLYRWHQSFIKGKSNLNALTPKFYRRGGAGQRVSDEQLEIIERVVREKYLTLKRLSIREVHSSLIAEVAKENATRPECYQLRVPGYDSLRRYIRKLSAYDVDLARYGREYARKKYRSSSITPRASFLLERVEIDHSPLDLFVIDDQNLLVLGRPYVTWAIDCYSRQILGFYISFTAPGVEAVFSCLKHMINKKNYVAEHYPDIQHEWLAYGIPFMLIVDNGLEFHAQDLLRATFELGINYQFCPPRTPWFKPMVERSLRTLAEQFAHLMPGTSFARWFDRYGYDPIREGIVTLPELIHALHIWIVDVYAQKYHRGLKTTPHTAWLRGAELSEPRLFDTERLNLVLSQQETRVLGHAGIELHGLRYNCDEMLVLRKQIGDRLRVQVRFNADDMGMVHVIHPMTKEAVPVPCLTPEYAVGLRLFQHRLIQKALKADGFAVTDKVQLAKAKEHMFEVVGRLMNSAKLSDRKRAAKAKGNNSAATLSQRPPLLVTESETESWHPKDGAMNQPSPLPVIKLQAEEDDHEPI